ncbi:type II toxin-antitoxin system HipA family toxin [Candidatus Desulfovibrio trichonymphae]|uniref:HipA-like protein kinase n=1 Tax=Candidatus Desulfovibrio trichonymphae TaxID=1725232 RepID=A0A1J1E3T5_9BACT|nr:type II toxin-antitoxin system HipA family toxin [Candidatus Desulfovibrio trichonymphae]BAV92112.1 HipA-like protein kinase [Candidatus Desulfovibrio trichonymphae]
MQNKVLNILYNGRKVGRLAETPDKLLAFEYEAGWLADGFSISPFKLPLEKRVFIASRDPFDGNFGVFNDSLPDGWGRLLIDRMLIKKHIDPFATSTLDRLAIVGTNGMGALEYKPEEQLTSNMAIDDLDTLAREAEAILNEKYDGKLEELVRIGGSSGGARPKVLIKIQDEDWLIKFRASADPKNIGKQEFDYMQAAKAAVLIIPETQLFEGKYFGVKRFDRRKNGGKVFMMSASGLLDTSHRLPTLDYNNLMHATLKLTRDYREAEKMFRLMCFNVFAHNRDDHAKNFSFLYDDGRWQVSPAYDLVYAEGMGGEHATTIDGEGRNPTEGNILSVATKSGLDQCKAKEIMKEVKTAVKKAKLTNL